MSKKIGFAIIGTGNIGRVHALAIQAIPEATLITVYDQQVTNARKIAQEFMVPPAASLNEIINNPAIDVVSICTPSGTHAELAIPLAQSGKHLFVEKPLDIKLERIDNMINAAKAAGVIITGILPSRFRDGIQKTYQAIQTGRLGKLVLITGSIKWFRSDEYYRGSWRGTWELDGGGALMNQSIHTIDLVQWLGGPIESIYGKTATLRHQIPAEDTGSALIEFKNGAQGIIQGATSCWPGDPARIEIHGTEGTILLEEGRIVRWELKNAPEDEQNTMLALEKDSFGGSRDPMGISPDLHKRQLVDLIDAIHSNRQPLIVGEEARKAVEIILAIYQSSQTDKKIHLPL
ncbi:Gfo/Idh/MocA family oxidoreductase [candidate division KSB1 bacterium]|nr:Gfo/Idh/MocA family oxidoreductase [candidate division KSB1 bacterium]